MTLCAIGFYVRAGKRESCEIMIKVRLIPSSDRMANRAIVRIVLGHMVRVCRPFEIGLVTTVAFRRCSGILSADVALRTLRLNVCARQRVVCLVMNRKCRRTPSSSRMAFRACRDKEIGPVLRRRRLGIV
jgi:hypothetical protein